MKISKRSWHYRWTHFAWWGWIGFLVAPIDKGYYQREEKTNVLPQNLCLYFWAVMWSPVWFMISTLMVASVVLVWFLWMKLVFKSARFVYHSVRKPDIGDNKPDMEAPISTLGMVVAFIKAKKQKVCPLIQFED